MPEYDYVKEQLDRLNPVDKYGITVKLTSGAGETKWLTLDVPTAKKILKLAKENKQ